MVPMYIASAGIFIAAFAGYFIGLLTRKQIQKTFIDIDNQDDVGE